jgi:hypothetical protein
MHRVPFCKVREGFAADVGGSMQVASVSVLCLFVGKKCLDSKGYSPSGCLTRL